MTIKERFDELSEMGRYYWATIRKSNISVIPSITDFYMKCADTQDKWKGKNIEYQVTRIFEAVAYFTENVPRGEILGPIDLHCIKGIMREVDKLYEEVISDTNTSGNEEYRNRTEKKIITISEIFCKNMVDMKRKFGSGHEGQIFERYKDLYLVTSLVNNHYDELVAKGFSLDSIWYPFWDVVKEARFRDTPLTEDEKLQSFIGLINGTMKFQPVYKATEYVIRPRDFDKMLFKGSTKAKILPQTDTIYSIEGKGFQKKLVRKDNSNNKQEQ